MSNPLTFDAAIGITVFAPVWQTYRDHILFAAALVVYVVGFAIVAVASNTWSELLPIPVLGALLFLAVPPLKRFRQVFCLVVVGALSLLAGGEILFRLRYFGIDAVAHFTDYTPLPPTEIAGFVSPTADPELRYVFTPGLHVRFNGTLWEINELGFRDHRFVEHKPAGVYRIVVLGDSFALGAGVARQERFSDQLLDILREAPRVGPVESYNLSLAGLSLFQLAHLMETRGPRYEADLILIGLRASQIHERERRRTPGPDLAEAPRPASESFSFPRRYAFVLNVQREAVDAGLSRIAAYAPWRAGSASAGDEKVGLTPFESLLARCAAYAREHQTHVVLVALRKMEFRSDMGLRASLANRALEGDASRRRDHREIARLAARFGVPVIDTYDAFDPDSRRSDYIVFPGDGHPNAAGHRRYAEAIADWLLESGLLPDAAER